MNKTWKRIVAAFFATVMLVNLPGVIILADELQEEDVIISVAEDPEILSDATYLSSEDEILFADDIYEKDMAEELVGIGNYGANLDTAYYHSPTNPFSWGQCTWYAYGRALEKTGVELPYRGDAKTWYSGAVSTPMANSIAVWKSGIHGHVAYVEAVENGILYISESNRGEALTYSEGTIRLSDGFYTPTYAGKTSAYTCGVPDGYIPLSNNRFISYIDRPVAGGNYSGNITIEGYALHKNGIRNVTAWINGTAMDCPMYNSPSVASVYPGYPTGREGFTASIPVSILKDGENSISIYAYEADDTPHLIADHTFYYNSFISYIDRPVAGGNYSGNITIEGYALHKNGIRNVTAWINGTAMDCPMYNSPSVASVYPGYPTGREGFTASIPVSVLKDGENSISIYAYEADDTPHLITDHIFNYSTVTNINVCSATLSTTNYTYDGSAKNPSVTVKNGSSILTPGTDYTVAYSNNTNTGTATVTITGKNNYNGKITKTFTIAKAAPTLKFASTSLSKKTGDAAFTNTLTKTTDGAVTFKSSNTAVATVNSTSGKVTIKGAGTATITANAAEGTNYRSGSASYTLTVTASKTDISGCTVTLSSTSYTYNGKARKPSVTVTDGTVTLTSGTDYTVSYSNNTNAGTATVTITGKGNYTGTISKTFTINKAAAKLTFANASVSKTTKDAAFTNTLTKTTDGIVTFKSSNTNVATVNSTSGKVTIKGAGTATVTVTASAGTNYKAGSANYTLTVTAPAPAGFSDVQDPSHPYYKAIYWAADAGITKGYPDGTFGIDRACTRSEAVMFLWRLAGKPEPVDALSSPFKDVPKTHAHYKAILWASQKGITKGYSDGTFGINKTCTRGQIMTFIWRFKGQPEPKAVAKSPFSDVPKNHAYYKAILWGAQNKITNGFSDGTFGINKDCTRGQIVTFLYRIK